ncbi:MAG: hypothetical protein SV253_00075 [Halobacteria archaeon]|nr:hypothetical protein [Halobacteria archaeon]
MALVDRVLQVVGFVLMNSGFLYLGVRFSTGDASIKKSLAISLAVAVTAGAVYLASPPGVLGVLGVVVVTYIAVQTAYDLSNARTALALIAYFVLTLAGGVIGRNLLSLV